MLRTGQPGAFKWIFLFLAILGSYVYTWWVHTEYLADIENMEQHLQTDINVIGRELEAKVVEKVFTQGRKQRSKE